MALTGCNMTDSWNGFRVVGSVEDNAPGKETGQSPLIKQLQTLLADVALFYHTVHEFHWNVTGPSFYEYHKLFDEIVSDTYDSIDPIAENIRKLGGYTRYRMSDLVRISDLSEVDEETGNAKALTKHLVELNSKLINTLMTTFNTANKSNQQGIANFIAERIDMHQKWNWFLKSSAE
jgi:starvation-inducible DNA-binding protein